MPEGPHNWPSCGEIDIMEQVSHETEFHATIHSHWRNDLGNYENPPSSFITAYNVGQFNTYGMEWTPEQITFSVNGNPTLTYPNLHLADEATLQQFPFNKPFYLILNYALGGAWPGPIYDYELPGSMEVDWVRVTEL
jgi:beta-glucanase (GH16 family)